MIKFLIDLWNKHERVILDSLTVLVAIGVIVMSFVTPGCDINIHCHGCGSNSTAYPTPPPVAPMVGPVSPVPKVIDHTTITSVPTECVATRPEVPPEANQIFPALDLSNLSDKEKIKILEQRVKTLIFNYDRLRLRIKEQANRYDEHCVTN